MGYEYKNGKYVFCKDGVYFAMTEEQVRKMQALCQQILGK